MQTLMPGASSAPSALRACPCRTSRRHTDPRRSDHVRRAVPEAAPTTANRGGSASTSAPGSATAAASRQSRQGGRSPRRGKPQPTQAQKALNAAIVAAGDPWAVLATLEAAGDAELSLVNLVTAFQRLAKHARRLTDGGRAVLLQHPGVQALSEAVMRESEAWGGFAVANLLWAHCMLRHGRPGMTALLGEKLLQKLPGMTPPEVGGSLTSLCKLRALDAAYFERLQPPLLAWLAEREGQEPLHERCLTGIMWAYGRCERRDAPVSAALAAAIKASLAAGLLSRRALASAVWAFAKLEHLDSELFDSLAAATLRTLPQRAPKQLAGAEAEELAFDLANLAWGFGRAHSLFVGATQPEFGRDDGLYTEYLHRVPVRALVTARVAAHLLPAAPHLTTRGLASVLYGMAVVRFYEPRLMRCLASLLRRRQAHLTLLAVAIAFWSLSTLRHDAPETYEGLATRALHLLGERRVREEVGEQVLNMVVVACAGADLRHLPQCSALITQLTGLISERGVGMLSTTQGLANIAWGLACLGQLDPALWRQICVQLTRRRDVTPRTLTQVYQADLALHLSQQRPSRDTAATDASAFLEECFSLGALKVASRRHWSQMLTQTWRSVTDLHWAVATSLHLLGGRFRVEFEAEDYSVDIALTEERIAIEVDGPTHFSRNTRRPLGFHAFKARLLGLRGWRVLNVPYWEWNELRNEEERQRYLAARLATLGWAPPAHAAPPPPAPPPAPAAGAGEAGEVECLPKPERPVAQLKTFGDLSAGDKLAVLHHQGGRGGGSKHKLLLDRAARRRT